MPDTTDKSAASPPSNAESVGPVSAATERILETVEQLDTNQLAQPSRCSGWTRAHVVAHVARNAEALTNLLSWATTGKQTPMYPSAEARDADIEAGARLGAAELVADLREAAARFSSAISQVPDEGWEQQVRTGPAATGRAIPARRVVWLRFREVEFHHVDLDAGYSPADWPLPLVSRALSEALRAVRRRDDVPPFTAVVDGVTEPVGTGGDVTIHGSPTVMLAWLTGRCAGADLRVEPAAPLPLIPAQAWL